jgi:hypothetical protein
MKLQEMPGLGRMKERPGMLASRAGRSSCGAPAIKISGFVDSLAAVSRGSGVTAREYMGQNSSVHGGGEVSAWAVTSGSGVPATADALAETLAGAIELHCSASQRRASEYVERSGLLRSKRCVILRKQ